MSSTPPAPAASPTSTTPAAATPVNTSPAALQWGHGPKRLEVFLEPTCPFSARAFGKFDALMAAAGEERLTLILRLLPQPWHAFSPITCRAVLAAACTRGGRDAARAVLAAIMAQRADHEPAEHCQGPVLDRSPNALLAQIERDSGVALRAAFEQPGLTTAVKWQARYARQNGVHVTPSFLIDGLLVPDMGSGETVEAWLGRLGLPA